MAALPSSTRGRASSWHSTCRRGPLKRGIGHHAMAYKRRKRSVDLRRASLPTLEKHLAQAQERASSVATSLAKSREEARLAPSQLKELQAKLAAVDIALSQLRTVRQPKGGLIGNLFGLTEQPATVKSQISTLELQRSSLQYRQSQLQRLGTAIQSWEASYEKARSWLSKLEEAVSRRRRKKDSLIELRAAVALSALETRHVGATVRRRLNRQPWCPYCGNPLGSDPHADHIYPVSKGGRSVPKNMVYVCAQCNSMKRNLTLAGFIRKFSLDRIAIEARLEQLNKEV